MIYPKLIIKILWDIMVFKIIKKDCIVLFNFVTEVHLKI